MLLKFESFIKDSFGKKIVEVFYRCNKMIRDNISDMKDYGMNKRN